MSTALLNLTDYTPLELGFFGTCGIMWVSIYILTIRHILKHKSIPLPPLAFCGYTAWDLLWGHFFQTDMGTLVAWGLKVYAPLDCFFLISVVLYGRSHFFPGARKHHIAAIMGALTAAWLAVLYMFIPVLDDAGGMTTAFTVMLTASSLSVCMLLRIHAQQGSAGLERLSYPVAWIKLVANTCGSTFCFLHLSDRPWLLITCSAMLTLDVLYVFLFSRLRKSAMDLPFASVSMG